MENFIKDRNEAFASMNKDKIIAYCKKYNVQIPKDENTFWAGVHKAVCNLYMLESDLISPQQYEESSNWLLEHGYTQSII